MSWCSHQAAAGDNPGDNPGDNSGDTPGNNPGDNSGDNPGANPGASAQLRVTSSLHFHSPEFSVQGEQGEFWYFCSAWALRRGRKGEVEEGIYFNEICGLAGCKRLLWEKRVSHLGWEQRGSRGTQPALGWNCCCEAAILPKFTLQTFPSITGAGVFPSWGGISSFSPFPASPASPVGAPQPPPQLLHPPS